MSSSKQERVHFPSLLWWCQFKYLPRGHFSLEISKAKFIQQSRTFLLLWSLCVVVKRGFLCIHLMKNMTLIRSCNRVLGFLMNIFASPPHGRPRDAPCFQGIFKKTYSFRQSYLFGLQKAGFDTTVILATGLKPFWTRWGRGF